MKGIQVYLFHMFGIAGVCVHHLLYSTMSVADYACILVVPTLNVSLEAP
jgi:hypothetical protein